MNITRYKSFKRKNKQDNKLKQEFEKSKTLKRRKKEGLAKEEINDRINKYNNENWTYWEDAKKEYDELNLLCEKWYDEYGGRPDQYSCGVGVFDLERYIWVRLKIRQEKEKFLNGDWSAKLSRQEDLIYKIEENIDCDLCSIKGKCLYVNEKNSGFPFRICLDCMENAIKKIKE